jgi:hypothetical protein
MKTKNSLLKLGIVAAIGITTAMSVVAANVKPLHIVVPHPSHLACVGSTTPGPGSGCPQNEDKTCKDEGLCCQWTVTTYSCTGVSGSGPDQCTYSPDNCSGGGTTDTAWCYTCAGGCCCGAN